MKLSTRLIVVILELISLIRLKHALISNVSPSNTTINRNLRRSYSSYVDPRTTLYKGICDSNKYKAILQIRSGNRGAAAATSFFQYVINQIIYAEKYNLLPWVHFTTQQNKVYDRSIHNVPPTIPNGRQQQQPVSFRALVGVNITEIYETGDRTCFDGKPYPGPPDYAHSHLRLEEIILSSSGVWETYFEPISSFHPPTMTPGEVTSCESFPLVDLMEHHHRDLLVKGVHYCAPWAVRGWFYGGVPPALRSSGGRRRGGVYRSMGEMRTRAGRIAKEYIRPKAWLVEASRRANPMDGYAAPPCLAMHVRHTDKGDGRTRVPLDEFLPYATSFVEGGGDVIYLATDSMENVIRIEYEWPERVSRRVRRQEGAFLSEGKTPIFDLVSHHRANTEALTDIYAMAKCGLILHGYSAMSESAIYVNGDLHKGSVNLEDPDHPSVNEFKTMVKNIINKKKW